MHCFRTRIAGTFALLLTAGVCAGSEPAVAPARYEVELIVFRHLDQGRNTAEIPAAFSIFRPSPLDLTVAELPLPATVDMADGFLAAAPETRVRRTPIGFQLFELTSPYPDFVPLRDDSRTLNPLYARLERIDAYEPIAHIGWVQPARGSDSARAYRFDAADIGHAGIAGTVTLYKERFLHLEVDLALQVEQSGTRKTFLLDATAAEAPDVHTLTESRRIRGTTAHYFDHPRFGVIARIQNVRSAVAEREETG